ncbi:hypothetical protein BDN67DRAFT_986314, partial [Paxillus ammoniavirescens]
PALDVCNIHTTAGLNYAKNGGGQPGSDKIKIATKVRLRGTSKCSSTVDSYGEWMKVWAKDVYLTEILEDSLVALNVTWEKDEGMSLSFRVTTFRPSRKRHTRQHSDDELGGISAASTAGYPRKKPRTSPIALTSAFIPTSSLNAARAVSGPSMSVRFIRALCSTVPETGEVEIGWPDNADTTPIRGLLGSQVFAQGRTKEVYK